MCAQLWLSCFKIENTKHKYYITIFQRNVYWFFFSSNLQWIEWKQCVYNNARLSTSIFQRTASLLSIEKKIKKKKSYLKSIAYSCFCVWSSLEKVAAKCREKNINVLKFGGFYTWLSHFYAIAVSLHKANGNQIQLVLLVSSWKQFLRCKATTYRVVTLFPFIYFFFGRFSFSLLLFSINLMRSTQKVNVFFKQLN